MFSFLTYFMLIDNSNQTLNLLLGPSSWLLISWIFDSVNSRKSVIFIHFIPFIFCTICFYPDLIYLTPTYQLYFQLVILTYNFIYYIFGVSLLKRVYLNLKSIDVKNKIFVSLNLGVFFSFFILFDLFNLSLISIHESLKVAIELSQKIGLLLIYCFVAIKEFEQKFIRLNFNLRKSKDLTLPVMQKDILPNPKIDLADIRITSFWEYESGIYLKKEFNLDKLCKHLKLERKIVLGLLYDTYQQNFNEVLNRYRIYHFVQKSKAEKNKFQKIETIIQDCGYCNRSTFYLAFKKISKLTPSEFVKKSSTTDV